MQADKTIQSYSSGPNPGIPESRYFRLRPIGRQGL